MQLIASARRLRRGLALAPAVASLAIPAAVALAAGSGVRGLLLRSGEQTGFTAHHVVVTRSIAGFLKLVGATARQKATFGPELKAAGFKAFAGEALTGRGRAQGFSNATEVGSAAGAKEVQALFFQQARLAQRPLKTTTFTITGVPGALGVRAVSRRASTTNVYWVEGSCILGAGDFMDGAHRKVSAPVIAGVRALRQRTRHACS